MKYLLIIITAVSIIAGCTGERVKPDVNPSLNLEELPAQESWDATIFFTDSGKTKAILKSGHISVFEESNETLLDRGVKVDFYNDEQVKTSTLTSKKGRVDDKTKDLYAMDSVVAKSDSVTLKTEQLMWRNKDRKIVSDKFVTIISEKEKIEGYGFESDQSLNNYTIYNITYITRMDQQEKNEK